ncbi:hypothetical protein CFP56_017084 [Quercus suber]|uniref:Uncharacterized protein n=1 Tax=Quercus suber TaxID=58331 RepID=A0AAW0M0W7_QUESU
MRCVWTLVMTWVTIRLVHYHPCHMMMRVYPIGLPMGTHLSPHPWFMMISAYPHPLLHLPYPPLIRLRPLALPLQMYITEILPSPPLKASHIEEIQGERIEWVEDWLRRSQQTRTHRSNCGTRDSAILKFVLIAYKSLRSETSQGISEEKKTRMIFDIMAWVEPKMVLYKWCVSLKNTIFNSTICIS